MRCPPRADRTFWCPSNSRPRVYVCSSLLLSARQHRVCQGREPADVLPALGPRQLPTSLDRCSGGEPQIEPATFSRVRAAHGIDDAAASPLPPSPSPLPLPLRRHRSLPGKHSWAVGPSVSGIVITGDTKPSAAAHTLRPRPLPPGCSPLWPSLSSRACASSSPSTSW